MKSCWLGDTAEARLVEVEAGDKCRVDGCDTASAAQLPAAARTLSANRFRQLSRDPAAPVWAGLGRGLATGLLRGKQVEIKIFSQHLVL